MAGVSPVVCHTTRTITYLNRYVAGMAREADHWDAASAAGREMTELVINEICAARGLPPIGGLALATGNWFATTLRAEVVDRLATLMHAAETASSGLKMDDIAQRLAEKDQGASQLYAALDRLLTEPGRERAVVLGAVLGESTASTELDEQEALHAILNVALSLDPTHARMLDALDRLADQIPPRHLGVSKEQLVDALPGLTTVLTGSLAAAVAAGTVIGYSWSPGYLFDGSAVFNEWKVSDLGTKVLSYLRLYDPETTTLQ